MCHIIRQEPGGLVHSDMLCPAHRRSGLRPPGCLPHVTFDKCLAHVKVTLFCTPVTLCIIWGDVDMADPIFLCEPVERQNVWTAIVCDDLADSAPPTQYMLEDKFPDGSSHF